MYHWNSAESVASMSAWRDSFVGLHGAGRITMEDAGRWTGRLEWQQSQSYGVALCGGVYEEFSRDARHIRSDPRGTCELLVPVAGSAIFEQGPSSGEIRPGDIGLCIMDRPVELVHGADFNSIALIVPQQEIEHRSPAVAREAHVVSGTSGLGRLIRRMITAIQEERENLSEVAFTTACEQLLDLACLATGGATDSAPAAQRERVEGEIRRYVRRHAEDPGLNVAGIARALGWSTRYLQEVLKAAGTTSRDLIRHERLHLARTRLASKSWAGQSVAEVAYACGFSSHASFSAAFREEFGMTPRDVRKAEL